MKTKEQIKILKVTTVTLVITVTTIILFFLNLMAFAALGSENENKISVVPVGEA
ncbi:MAG: hypothetical protein HQK53_10200 [Oligoflexia bacterium]|nr:hypothetical protein [Oligoflexia bacterium]